MTCGERAGFLFAHDCDRPAAGACADCGKAVCLEHQRLVEGRLVCVSCHLSTLPAQEQPAPAGRGELDDDPYLYGRRHYAGYTAYDTRDYRAFDRDTTPAAGGDAESFEDDPEGT